MLPVKKVWQRVDRWTSRYREAFARSATDAGVWEPWLRRRAERKRARARGGPHRSRRLTALPSLRCCVGRSPPRWPRLSAAVDGGGELGAAPASATWSALWAPAEQQASTVWRGGGLARIWVRVP